MQSNCRIRFILRAHATSCLNTSGLCKRKKVGGKGGGEVSTLVVQPFIIRIYLKQFILLDTSPLPLFENILSAQYEA